MVCLQIVIWSQVFLSNANNFEKDLFDSWLIHQTLTGTESLDQSGPGSNCRTPEE